MEPVRKDTRVVAPIALLLEVDGKTQPVFTRNISLGGMFVVTQRKAPTGSMVRIQIVRGKVRLETQAKVVKEFDDGMGLRYENSSAEFDTGIRDLIGELLKEGGKGGHDISEVDGSGQINCSWTRQPDGKSWNWWRKSMKNAHFKSLAHDGGAIEGRGSPDVGEVIVVFLSEESSGEQLSCDAECVRHIEGGFAVKFVSPSIAFRRQVSLLRQQ